MKAYKAKLAKEAAKAAKTEAKKGNSKAATDAKGDKDGKVEKAAAG